MPAPLALSQFFLRTKGGACKNWSAAPGCRYPNWRRARSALANLDGCPCSSSAVSAAGSASLTQPLTAPCFVRWTRSLFVPPHAGEPPLSGASRQLSRGESQVYARGWRLSGGKANLKRPLLLDAFSRRSRLPFGAPAGDAPAGRRGYIYGRRAAQLRRCLRQKQPKRSRGSGLSFARAQRRPKQKQGTATRGVDTNNAGASLTADPRRGTLSFVTQKFFCFGAINNRRNNWCFIPLCRHSKGWCQTGKRL